MRNSVMQYYDWIRKLEETSGTNAKLAILKEALDDPVFALYAKYIYDPTFVPHVRKIKPNIVGLGHDKGPNTFLGVLKLLLDNDSRTDAVVNIIETLFHAARPEEVPYLYRFLNRDMRCGVNSTLINRALPGLIPEFPIGLAARWNEKHVRLPVFAEPKLDGLRCVTFVIDGHIEFKSRNGKTLELDPKFCRDIRELSQGDDFVFDGELMGQDFQQLMTQAKRKKNKNQRDLKYWIFDGMPLADWESRKTKRYLERKDELLRRLGVRSVALELTHEELPSIGIIQGWPITHEKQLFDVFEKFVDAGFEGAVLKQDTPYDFKRSKNWLKLKPEETYDCVIVNIVAGEPGKKFENTLGALWVEYEGVKTQVGTGFSDQLRDEIWCNKDEYIGMCVEVFGEKELTNDGCIRFPRFKKFRPDKD